MLKMDKFKLINSLVRKALDIKMRMETLQVTANSDDIESKLEDIIEKSTCIGRLEVIQEILDEIE